MARPPEKTYAYGLVPYEDTPAVCQSCGKITRWHSFPALVGKWSEDADVVAQMDEIRGEPFEGSMTPAIEREGGMAHRHTHFTNAHGEPREQYVGGDNCDSCSEKQITRHFQVTSNTAAIAKLLKAYHPEEAATGETLEELGKPTEAEEARILSGKDKEEKKDS